MPNSSKVHRKAHISRQKSNGSIDNKSTGTILCILVSGEQEYYDPANTWCNFPSKVDCGQRPICDKNDENCVYPDSSTTKKPDDFDCPADAGYFADPKNCIKYYHCYNGIVEEHLTCPLDNGENHRFITTHVLISTIK